MEEKKYTCPCCGYRTLSIRPPGTYEICYICGWEDDPVQFNDPDSQNGANTVTLREAQQNFVTFGYSTERVKTFVRKPLPSDIRDSSWSALPPIIKKES